MANSDMGEDAKEIVDRLAATIAAEKTRLTASLASGEVAPVGSRADLGTTLDDLQSEVSELRRALASMRESLDGLNEDDG